MSNTTSQSTQPGIVLIADRTYQSYKSVDITGDKLEMISDDYFNDIFKALTSITEKVIHYNSPQELIDNAQKHKQDLVFTIYGGRASRNRMALVPAVCEAAGIKFIGADAYARIVCQDKFLAKTFARRFGLTTPDSLLISSEIPENPLQDLSFPLVIKPNFEGSSIGITDSSKVKTLQEAIIEIKRQQELFNQPILAEEFVSGSEVCICVVGQKGNITLFEVMEVVCQEDETFLYDRLYTANEKHLSDKEIYHRKITSAISSVEQQRIISAYEAMGKMDFMRIDGRVKDGKFTLIEFTPDGYLGEDSSFSDASKENGFSYEDLLRNIIRNALAYYQTPYSSYIKS